VTGHVLKVDGGKSMTTRGQQHWYGAKYMSRKFEQDEKSYYNFMLSQKKVGMPP